MLAGKFYILVLNHSSKNFKLSPWVFGLFVSVASVILIFQVL